MQWCYKIDDTLPNLDKLVYATEPIITSAGDVVILGFCDKADSATDDALIVKLNAEGQVQWLKTYGLPSSNFRMYEILEMPDGHFIVATDTYNNGEESMQVVKLDPQGNIVANVQYAFSNYEWVEEIFLDLEGNIVIVSGDDIKPDSNGGMVLTKLTPSLEILERKGYTYQNWFYGYHAVSLPDGGYLLTGEYEEPVTYNYYSLLMKF